MAQLHIMFEGESYDPELDQLDVGVFSTDNEIRTATARHLSGIFGYDVPVNKFSLYAVDKNQVTGEITLRPQAVFG
jgi:hypothetical protein